MFQFLNRLVKSVRPLPLRTRRNHCRYSVAAPACESLEDRQMLAVAGISTDVSLLRVTESSAVEFTVQWQPTGSGDANSVGLNLRIHYDSSALEYGSSTNVYQTGFSAQQETAEANDRDDGATSTNRVAKFLWVDLQGTWPSLQAGSRLLTIQFVTKPGFGSTVVNLDATTVNDVPVPRRQVTVNQVPVLTGPAASDLTARPEITWTPVTLPPDFPGRRSPAQVAMISGCGTSAPDRIRSFARPV